MGLWTSFPNPDQTANSIVVFFTVKRVCVTLSDTPAFHNFFEYVTLGN